jgi:hypothetical protein
MAGTGKHLRLANCYNQFRWYPEKGFFRQGRGHCARVGCAQGRRVHCAGFLRFAPAETVSGFAYGGRPEWK